MKRVPLELFERGELWETGEVGEAYPSGWQRQPWSQPITRRV